MGVKTGCLWGVQSTLTRDCYIADGFVAGHSLRNPGCLLDTMLCLWRFDQLTREYNTWAGCVCECEIEHSLPSMALVSKIIFLALDDCSLDF